MLKDGITYCTCLSQPFELTYCLEQYYSPAFPKW